MDRKHSRGSNERASRIKKRKFAGNRYTREADTSFTSTSAQKLSNTQDEEIIVDSGHGYRIIAFLSVFTSISQFVICKECKEQVRFGESSTRGLGFKIAVQCKCDTRYINSCPLIDNKSYEINRRLIFVMRLLGVGKEGINLFCGLMDLSQSFSNYLYNAAVENIYIGAKTVFDVLRRKAVEEEKMKNSENGEPMGEITVYNDGTWKKRGFNSLFGITTLIGKYTSKVVDLVVKSAYCHACKLWESKCGTPEYLIWLDEHVEECTANHEGSAEKMEVDAVKEMFQRSWELSQVKYIQYIGDGDSKTSKALLDINNESFNSTVWGLAPKHLHCGAKIVEIAAYLATGIFNEGFCAILKTMTTIGIIVGEKAKMFSEERDQHRLERSARGKTVI